MNIDWSWVITAIGATTLFLTGRSRRVGWTFGLCSQSVWLAYGLMTEQHGLAASAFIFGPMYVANLTRYYRKRRAHQQYLAEAPAMALPAEGRQVSLDRA